jgi:2-methylcitrate dehydratase
MEKIDFRHGGPEYDRRYPDGIPTTVEIEHAGLGNVISGLVMYPEGHARCTSRDLSRLLRHKFSLLASSAIDNTALTVLFSNVIEKSPQEITSLYDFHIMGVAESSSLSAE